MTTREDAGRGASHGREARMTTPTIMVRGGAGRAAVLHASRRSG